MRQVQIKVSKTCKQAIDQIARHHDYIRYAPKHVSRTLRAATMAYLSVCGGSDDIAHTTQDTDVVLALQIDDYWREAIDKIALRHGFVTDDQLRFRKKTRHVKQVILLVVAQSHTIGENDE